MYRVCQQPVSSFGIICYRKFKTSQADENVWGGEVAYDESAIRTEFLMVQRKDSLAFVEFVRGKYNIQNRGYISKLLSSMTLAEREKLSSCSFDELWHGFWQSAHTRTFVKEYEQSKSRFMMLRGGYYLRTQSNGLVFFSMGVAVNATSSDHEDTEFGFPKGRRNINESDLDCALREFEEETLIDSGSVTVKLDLGPFEEVFIGSNGVRYRHVYYLAELSSHAEAWKDVGIKPVVDPIQLREVKAVGWFRADDVMSKIRKESSERRDMFGRVLEVMKN